MRSADDAFRRQLAGYSLTTAMIYYYLPDNPDLINPRWILWQNLDMAPYFPGLRSYCRWWNKTLDGKLSHVIVSHAALIRPAEFRFTDHELIIH